jgi:hypothetical protein
MWLDDAHAEGAAGERLVHQRVDLSVESAAPLALDEVQRVPEADRYHHGPLHAGEVLDRAPEQPIGRVHALCGVAFGRALDRNLERTGHEPLRHRHSKPPHAVQVGLRHEHGDERRRDLAVVALQALEVRRERVGVRSLARRDVGLGGGTKFAEHS